MTADNNTEVVEPQKTEEQPSPKTADEYFGYDPSLFEEVAKTVEETETKSETEPEQKKTVAQIQEEVNRYLKEIKVDDNGKFIYPEEIDPTLKVAIAATKSARDQQRAFSRTQTELKKAQAELEALRKQLAQGITPDNILTPEQRQELDQLKYQDPEAWYRRMRQLEEEAQNKVNEQLEEVSKKAKEETEVEYRLRRLEEFNKGRETPVTPEQLELMVPPIYAKQLLDGKIDFDEYLEKAVAFIEGPKVVAPVDEPPKTKDLSQVTGSPEPIKESHETGIDYANIVF